MSCLCIICQAPPPLGHMIEKCLEVRELINIWNTNIYTYYIPLLACCLNVSVSIWTNQWMCPSWISIPWKSRPFANEFHTITIADGLTNILF